MDVKGAKALQERLGHKQEADSPPSAEGIPEDAPPVYHYLGVPKTTELAQPQADDAASSRRPSWIRRLGLSFR